MLTAPHTVLSVRYPPVVYVNTVRGAVNINYWWIPYV
jgi:hypothetical protein